MADKANAGRIKSTIFSQAAFPIQKEGSKNNTYWTLSLIKNGITVPTIISIDNFATAIPSNLFEESVRTNSPTIIPCRVPAAASIKMAMGDKVVSLKTGSRIRVTRNAAIAGTPNRADR